MTDCEIVELETSAQDKNERFPAVLVGEGHRSWGAPAGPACHEPSKDSTFWQARRCALRCRVVGDSGLLPLRTGSSDARWKHRTCFVCAICECPDLFAIFGWCFASQEAFFGCERGVECGSSVVRLLFIVTHWRMGVWERCTVDFVFIRTIFRFAQVLECARRFFSFIFFCIFAAAFPRSCYLLVAKHSLVGIVVLWTAMLFERAHIFRLPWELWRRCRRF